jgi:hypothetical protein
MAFTGPDPNPNSINRNTPAAEWTEVEDVPYKGKRPSLPVSRTVLAMGKPIKIPLQSLTKDWWETVTALPHCKLWTPGDWNFALTTAIVADNAYTGVASAWSELRRRENDMGVTAEARRKLRIRYVPASANKAAKKPAGKAAASATVTSIDERRQRQRAS